MKRALLALCVLLLPVTGASAQIAWQGEAIIDTATAPCSAGAGVVAGSVVTLVLQPKNLTGNTANTIASFNFNKLGQFALVMDHGAMPTGTGAAFGNDMTGLLKANVNVHYTQMRQTPPTLTEASAYAELKGRVEDFLFVTNCDVTFRAALTKND